MKNQIRAHVDFFISSRFCFFKSYIGLSLLLRCFIDILGQNRLKNEFLDKKKTLSPNFSATTVARI